MKERVFLMEGDNNNNNFNPFRWQRPLGKSTFVLFYCGIRRGEEGDPKFILTHYGDCAVHKTLAKENKTGKR